MAAGFASCTGEDAAPWTVANGRVDYLKGGLKGLADECGLTAPFTPPGFDTCFGAQTANPIYVFDLPCGPAESRTPGTGKCASTACADLVDSFTDANVELMAAAHESLQLVDSQTAVITMCCPLRPKVARRAC